MKFNADSFIDPSKTRVTYEEFIDTELIQFSQADNHRSIPSSVDGLKPAQRKVLHGCFKKNLTNDVKVVQLAGYIAEQTAYHHGKHNYLIIIFLFFYLFKSFLIVIGEASLHSTIINMAQNYVGSNNTPLLEPSGQFGTRAQGGKDFASPRYIYTKLSPLARALFPISDDAILEYMEEDGQIVEPKYFLPVIPSVLLNGCNGIGTGWSTNIPSYNIIDICEYITNMIKGKVNEKKFIPWVRGFEGEMIKKDKTDLNFISRGIVKRTKKSTIEVTELPIGKWTNDYKEILCKMVIKGEIKSFTEDHTTNKAKFVINIPKALLDDYVKTGLIKAMKLESSLSLNNMHSFNSNGTITKYTSPEEFIQEFYPIRLDGYVRRKDALLSKLIIEEKITRSKSQFVNDILSGELSIINKGNKSDNKLRNEYDIIQELKNRNYYSAFNENNEIGNNIIKILYNNINLILIIFSSLIFYR
jgi:DNA topoisomerase-2